MSEKTELETRFEAAAERVNALTKDRGNMELLDLYAMFKQGTVGDVQGTKPGMFDFKGAAKYGAWEKLKGLSKVEAQEKYIATVDSLVEKYS